MLSSDGQPVGVFAIFSREPRDAFTAAQRRELAGYSAMALSDLTQQAKWLAGTELRSDRSTPLLQRDSRINGDYRPPAANAQTHVEIDHALVPPGLRYHKQKTPPTNATRVFLNQQLSPDSRFEQTPPSSSEGSEGDSFPGHPRGFGKNHKDLSVKSDLSQYASSGDMITPDSEDFCVPTPRPFSASDLTSLNPHPPNSPVLLGQDTSFQANSDLTVESFMSLSDRDCAEEESPLIDLSTPESQPNESTTVGAQSLAPPRFANSSISTAMASEPQKFKDPMAEAAFSCSFTAQNQGYDLIYVVDIKPTGPFMTDQELLAPGGLQKRIVVAYGLDRPMELATQMHINVLRSRGFQIWENRDATYDNGEFRTGYLLPLSTESGPRRQRSSGLIFGAFRRPKLVEVGPIVHISSQEMQRLLESAHTLRDLVLKQPDTRRPPKRANTEPTTQDRYPANEAIEVQVGRFSVANPGCSFPNRYATNEAVEVRKRLLDETPGRYLANEAVEVQMERHPLVSTSRSPPKPHLPSEVVQVEKHLPDETPYRYPPYEAAVGRHNIDEAPYRCPTREAGAIVTHTPEPYYATEAVEVAKISYDSGIGSSEHASLERMPAREAVKVKKAGKSEPASPDRKISKEATTSKKTGKSAPTSPDRKASKESKRATKLEKAAKTPLDAVMDRPFHAINRFRPF